MKQQKNINNNSNSTGRIGYACTPISIPYRTSRSFLLKNFSEEVFLASVKENLQDLMAILQWNKANQVFMFRIGSDIIPFGSHESNHIPWWEIFASDLKAIGDFIKAIGMRVSMHPGQYTVLNSLSEDIVARSLQDVEYHCRFLAALGVDYSHKCILHVGGVYGDKADAMQRFKTNYASLSSEAKHRLILENDDKLYTIEDVLLLCQDLQISAVFDNLHHQLNPCALTWDEILDRVSQTWREHDGNMKLHYSEQDSIKKGGAHSKTVDTQQFLKYYRLLDQYQADVMLEVKDKELSALKCIYATRETNPISVKTNQWAKYKYAVMEKNYSSYVEISKLVNANVTMASIYEKIDACLNLPFDAGNFVNTAQHVYGYVKNHVSDKEKKNFQILLEDPEKNMVAIKRNLKRLCEKYAVKYLLDSYYFII